LKVAVPPVSALPKVYYVVT